MSERIERRKQPRRQVKWPINILADHGTIEGVTENISQEGLFIRCEEPLLLYETYRISIMPPDREAVGAVGKVVWSEFYGMGENDSTFGIGICLIEITEEYHEVIDALISETS
ncbi:MAG: PilZ domain-containing protein [Deltaproteobacteria bacterium]|nr:PilZ domain-containing protein [Deltaproteobacteria bacterium]